MTKYLHKCNTQAWSRVPIYKRASQHMMQANNTSQIRLHMFESSTKKFSMEHAQPQIARDRFRVKHMESKKYAQQQHKNNPKQFSMTNSWLIQHKRTWEQQDKNVHMSAPFKTSAHQNLQLTNINNNASILINNSILIITQKFKGSNC